MPERKSLFVGRSGELAVLSEFLYRGYNAATPEIDVGEDVFVIEDGKEGYWPVQVKTATASEESKRCSAQFRFKRSQLVLTPTVELTYVLALRRNGKWGSFLVIPRFELYQKFVRGELGQQDGEWIKWTFVYEGSHVSCQGSDFTVYESNWDEQWPDLLREEYKSLY